MMAHPTSTVSHALHPDVFVAAEPSRTVVWDRYRSSDSPWIVRKRRATEAQDHEVRGRLQRDGRAISLDGDR